ncbi:alpha-1B adrenergic receptor-like [Pomacea canaliculata]|uniref:alpha-1B adrenergic receptor-like n=1 Tax=Pomacea canaliculata TaxID=400727 RepID=UPI000D73E1DA|nr:alpha-1B adrenergic receptor-like [Pomacea canaliculata]
MEYGPHEENKNTTSSNLILEDLNSLGLIAFVTIAVLIIGLAVLGNALEIIVAYMSPQMRSLSDMFVLNLACCHLLQATFCMPISLYSLNKSFSWQTHRVLCTLWLLSLAISVQVSAFSLCLITLDIYLEITHQKWYRNWLNTPKVVIALCAVWVIPLAVNTWPLTPTLWPQLVEIDKDQCVFRAAPLLVYTSVTFDFLLPGVCITVLYVFVFCYCRKRLQSSKVTRMDYADFCRIFDPFEYRTLIVMGIQVFAFVVLWMPFWIYTCLVASYGVKPSYFARKITVWLCYMTTLVTPMLHFFGNWKFQHVLKRLFGWRRASPDGRVFIFTGYNKVFPNTPPLTSPAIRQDDEVTPV